MNQLTFQFYDVTVAISSDSATYLDIFGKMYPRFRREVSEPTLNFQVLTRPDNPWGEPVLVCGEQVWPFTHLTFEQGYIYETVLHTIIAAVRSHLLIHAGVVSNGEQALIIAADSGHGKTTLVLELLRRGWRFLSDEMAAIERSSGLVHPFPRSLRLRPGTLEKTGFLAAQSQADQWLDKLLLDIDQIQPDSVGQPAPIGGVVILTGPQAEAEIADHTTLHLVLDRTSPELLAQIEQLEPVERLTISQNREYPLLTITASNRMAALTEIEARCQAAGVLVLDVIKRWERPPASFDQPARLTPLPTSQAIIALLRRFQPGHKSALLAEFGGSTTPLFISLARLIGSAPCANLRVGPLSDMADLVEGLVTG